MSEETKIWPSVIGKNGEELGPIYGRRWTDEETGGFGSMLSNSPLALEGPAKTCRCFFCHATSEYWSTDRKGAIELALTMEKWALTKRKHLICPDCQKLPNPQPA